MTFGRTLEHALAALKRELAGKNHDHPPVTKLSKRLARALRVPERGISLNYILTGSETAMDGSKFCSCGDDALGLR